MFAMRNACCILFVKFMLKQIKKYFFYLCIHCLVVFSLVFCFCLHMLEWKNLGVAGEKQRWFESKIGNFQFFISAPPPPKVAVPRWKKWYKSAQKRSCESRLIFQKKNSGICYRKFFCSNIIYRIKLWNPEFFSGKQKIFL